MNEFETGLRHRLRRALRQTAQQHQRLQLLHRRLDEALERGALDAVHAAAQRLHAALKAHFELEDAVIFPAFHGLAQRSAHDLNALAREHRRYLTELERLCAQLDAAALAKFAGAYRNFSTDLADHERREEALLSSLEGAADSPLRSGEPPHSEARRSR
jgi:iron-sulfur cluster repair protein YtfE (RIC family)